MPRTKNASQPPRTVIVGAGFAGLEVARALGKAGLPAAIADRQNYYLFQPLLYQVATAALSPADIAEPIRKMLGRYASVDVLLAEVTAIDLHARRLSLADGTKVSFDILVLATGAAHGYFGHEEWSGFAPGLKTIEDARRIRSRLLLAFEKADMCADPAERKRLTTFAVIGGGPTGVELAGSIAELARYTLARDFHRIRPQTASVLMLEAGPRILAAFPESLAAYAQATLQKLGVAVRTNCPVERVDPASIVAGGETIAVGVSIWAAGVTASPLGKLLGVSTDRAGRIAVTPQLSVPGLEDVYVLGDLARAPDRNGNPLPGLAQVAKQEGSYLGRTLARRILYGEAPKPFAFHNRGNTAIIGRHAAVFDFGWWRLKGRFAWAFWALIHIYLLAGFEHRLLVALQWLWLYLTYQRGARLIVEPENAAAPAAIGDDATTRRDKSAGG